MSLARPNAMLVIAAPDIQLEIFHDIVSSFRAEQKINALVCKRWNRMFHKKSKSYDPDDLDSPGSK